MSPEPVPEWLIAWRERQALPCAPVAKAPSAARRPRTTPSRPRPAPTPPTARLPTPERRTGPQEFSEPLPWPWDGGVRREAVLDTDFNPPRLVRRVGWCFCLRCRQPFWSEDVVGQRLCAGPGRCREEDERYAGGLTGGSYRLRQASGLRVAGPRGPDDPA